MNFRASLKYTSTEYRLQNLRAPLFTRTAVANHYGQDRYASSPTRAPRTSSSTLTQTLGMARPRRFQRLRKQGSPRRLHPNFHCSQTANPEAALQFTNVCCGKEKEDRISRRAVDFVCFLAFQDGRLRPRARHITQKRHLFFSLPTYIRKRTAAYAFDMTGHQAMHPSAPASYTAWTHVLMGTLRFNKIKISSL